MAIKGTGRHRVQYVGTPRFVGNFGYCRNGDILMMEDGDWPRLKISRQFRECPDPTPKNSPQNKKAAIPAGK